MKKIILLITLIGMNFGLKAQNIFPSSGDVGIGTISPSAKLHISGTAGLMNKIHVTNASVGGDGGYLDFNMGSSNSWAAGIKGYVPSGQPGIDRVFLGLYTTTYDGGLQSRVERMTITDRGNVGIGTSNPSDKLEVNKNGGGIDLTHSNSSSYSSIESFEASSSQAAIQFIGSQFNSVNRRNAFEIVNRMPSGNIDFFTENSFTLPKLRISGNGNVGIGISSPLELLEVGGNVFINKENSGLVIDAANQKRVGFMKYRGKEAGLWRSSGQDFEIGRVSGTDITQGLGSTPETDFYINGSGQVGIGTISTGTHKLAVEGSIGAREIKVEASGWSDFVFYKDYELRTLVEVEQHINENGHLPEIPSEVEVTENGINLGEMNAKLLQKIEELTLYLIQQNKQNLEQQKLIEQLQREVSALKNE